MAPHPACAGQGSASRPQATGLLSGQVLGAATALGVLLLSARLSLNKQGCIATNAWNEPTAPRMGKEGARRPFPLVYFLCGSPRHWVLPRGQPVLGGHQRESWAPLHGD